jgi:hypothetical protein
MQDLKPGDDEAAIEAEGRRAAPGPHDREARRIGVGDDLVGKLLQRALRSPSKS